MVSEAETGYICGFDVYTGKDSKHDDATCAKTTSTVMDLLDSIKLLDKGHYVYFDNYYNSPELIEKLLERKNTRLWHSEEKTVRGYQKQCLKQS